jgi:hypothetical protein
LHAFYLSVNSLCALLQSFDFGIQLLQYFERLNTLFVGNCNLQWQKIGSPQRLLQVAQYPLLHGLRKQHFFAQGIIVGYMPSALFNHMQHAQLAQLLEKCYRIVCDKQGRCSVSFL